MAPTRTKRTLDVLTPNDGLGRTRRSDDDVGALELLLNTLEWESGAAEAFRQLGGSVQRAIRDDRDLRTARQEVPGRLLADPARTAEKNQPSVEAAEDLLSKCRRGGWDRRGRLADSRLRAGLSPGVERLAEEAVEQGAGRAGVESRANLAQDLALARDQRIEPCGDAEQMQCRRLVAQPIERAPELGLALEQDPGRARFCIDVLVVRDVELGAVAGREANRL